MSQNLAPLTSEEEDQLVSLLRRAQWPLKPDVFRGVVGVTVTVPIELLVLDDQNRVLVFWRKDDEYEGNHIPGTVLRDNEDVPMAIQRLLDSEVVGGEVTPPISLGWIEITKGNGFGKNPTRHEISLLHVCWLKKPYQGKGGKFYPVGNLPENMLSHHRVLIAKAMARWVG